MRIVCATALLSSALVLSGCTAAPPMTSTTTQPNQVQGAALHGRVHGGNQPIVGASVYLYAANTTGYGNASVSVLASPGYVTTDGSGNFSITSDYTCPSASTQVYLYALGGNPGAGSNSAAGLLAGLGSCGSLSSSTYIVINEVSTIVTAYSLAGYATDATHVSSSGSTLALTGVANAFATIPNMETLGTGVALAVTPSTFGNVPQSEINTLANILAACINTTGPSSTGCTTLLGSALSGGTTGTAPTDTATAAINIAHNPGANIAALYGLQPGTGAPFLPDISAQPDDFAMGITFPGPGGWGGYSDLAIDGSGNVWVVGGFSPAGDGVGELLANTLAWSSSTPMTGGGLGGGQPTQLAIDPSENVWITNNSVGNGSPCVCALVELSSSGAVLSGSGGYTTTLPNWGDLGPLAADGSGNVWLPNGFDVLFEYIPGTGFLPAFDGGGINNPTSVAIDASGNTWVPNSASSGLSELNSSGMGLPGSPYTGAGEANPTGIAIDASGNAWLANEDNATVSEYSSSGAPLSTSSGYAAGPNNTNDWGIAIDGAGYVWVTGRTCCGNPHSITELSSSGALLSGTNGYGTVAQISAPSVIAIDGSGNVWIIDTESYNYIDEFVGLAAPVVTPLAANLTAPYGAHAVNRP